MTALPFPATHPVSDGRARLGLRLRLCRGYFYLMRLGSRRFRRCGCSSRSLGTWSLATGASAVGAAAAGASAVAGQRWAEPELPRPAARQRRRRLEQPLRGGGGLGGGDLRVGLGLALRCWVTTRGSRSSMRCRMTSSFTCRRALQLHDLIRPQHQIEEKYRPSR